MKSETKELQLIKEYEKKIFDLTQLIEISKSLNSNLDYHALIQSILYICMGQLKLLKAGLFVRKDISSQDLQLHRSQVGFDLTNHENYIIHEGDPLFDYLHNNPHSHSLEELVEGMKGQDLSTIESLSPVLIVPLRAKNVINGILLLGDPIGTDEISPDERSYVENIAILAGIAVHNAFLYEITTTDVMTRLRLKHFFLDYLSNQISLSRRTSKVMTVIMIDIDDFKKINDEYGHVMGDEVLVGVSNCILNNVRQTDIACRFGGEEFAILLPDTDQETAVSIAERIRSHVRGEEIEYNKEHTEVTVSLGIALYDPKVHITAQQFINSADSALYVSKKNGKNQVNVFSN